jgi:Family of unknown function (DUF5808)
MTVQSDQKESANEPGGSLPPQGHIAGAPYDLRRPNLAKGKARLWNPGDPRFFTPKIFGAGWDINFYWLFHPRST